MSRKTFNHPRRLPQATRDAIEAAADAKEQKADAVRLLERSLGRLYASDDLEVVVSDLIKGLSKLRIPIPTVRKNQKKGG